MLRRISEWFSKREVSRLEEILSSETNSLKRKEIQMQIKMCKLLTYQDYKLFYKNGV
jgi:hypothetical protein